jgi:hypothetical protein
VSSLYACLLAARHASTQLSAWGADCKSVFPKSTTVQVDGLGGACWPPTGADAMAPQRAARSYRASPYFVWKSHSPGTLPPQGAALAGTERPAQKAQRKWPMASGQAGRGGLTGAPLAESRLRHYRLARALQITGALLANYWSSPCKLLELSLQQSAGNPYRLARPCRFPE